MNFSRKTILVAGVALLAACGDKIEVVEYVPPTTVNKINSVEVSPAVATINKGDAISFTAAVNADPGVSTTPTWSASNSTVQSALGTDGVITATESNGFTAGTYNVCASATSGTQTVKGCATLVVSPAVASFPATVSIASTTAGGTFFPVNPAAVIGQMDVTLNINPGNQVISKVELLVGGKVACSQTFTAAQSAALRYAADEAVAAQTTFPQIVCSVNTADYSTTTGMPTWLNGTQAMQAKVYTVSGGTAAAASASVTQNLVFANIDGFHITHSNTGTPGSFVDAAGYRWNGGGSLTVNALPVMYSGSAVGTVVAALGANGACPAVGAIGTATTATGSAYVITGAMTGLQSAAACATTTPNLITITATSAAGDNLTLAGTGVLNAQSGLRWDNVAPPTAGLIAALAVNGRSGNWINDVVILNSVNSATNLDGAIAAAVTDLGVGGTIAYNVKVGTTYANTKTGTALTNTSTLAPAATNATYCAIAYTADALGNTQSGNPGGTCAAPAAAAGYALPGAGVASVPFGVDRAPPVASFSSAAPVLASNGAYGVLTAPSFKVVANDTGLTGNSGFIAGTVVTHVAGSVSRRNAAGTSGTAVTVTSAAASNTNFALTRYDGLAALVADTLYYDASGITTNAYYTMTTSVVDQAGNPSGSLTRTVLKDNTLPTALAPVQNVVSPTAGGAITFVSNIADDLDLSSAFLGITFPAASFSGILNVAGAVAAAPATYGISAVGPITLNTYNNPPVVTSGTLTATLPALYALQGQTDSSTAVGNAYPNGIYAVVSDMFNADVVSTAGTLQNPPAAPALYVIGTDYTKFLLSRSGTTVNVAGSATAGAVVSRNITPRVEGTTTMTAPFSTVDIYVLGTGQLAYTFLGTSTLTSQTDNGGQRIWGFTPVAFAPSATFPQGANSATVIGIARGTGGKYVMGQGVNLTVSP